MAEPFWQRSLDSISYIDIVAFLDEGNPEGTNLEYKGATIKPQNGMIDFTNEVLETLVAFANTSGGMMLYGVDEDPATKLPVITRGIEATTPKAQQVRDPAIPLISRCVQAINPRISLETKPIVIEDGPAKGNKLLLIRVRQGAQPPYSLDNRMIHIRNGEHDPLATVMEIEAMFRRRVDEGIDDLTSPNRAIQANVFDYASLAPDDDPQCFMLSLTAAFPVASIRASAGTDAKFARICLDVFGDSRAIIRDPRGVMYMPSLDPDRRYDPACGMAFDDGSIGLRKVIGPNRGIQLGLVGVWKMMRELLYHAARWPRGTFNYGGPLICRFAVSNIDGVVVGDDFQGGFMPQIAEPFRNRMKYWTESYEWTAGMTRDTLIKTALASLARQLQFPYIDAIAAAIPDNEAAE